MDFHRKWTAYFYAIALSLWTAVIPISASPSSVADAFGTTPEQVFSHEQSESAFLVSSNSAGSTLSYRTGGDNLSTHFFNEGNFQFVFLKNIVATAFSLLKAGDINFEFIDLIYPFHCFW